MFGWWDLMKAGSGTSITGRAEILEAEEKSYLGEE